MSADPAAIPSRSRLLSLLTEACELEHGLACSYLYAAFSLKQDLAEGGLTWRQLQAVRLWASEIYMIAAEEMLHLAQVWNILAAVGGSPHYGRPNFRSGAPITGSTSRWPSKDSAPAPSTASSRTRRRSICWPGGKPRRHGRTTTSRRGFAPWANSTA